MKNPSILIIGVVALLLVSGLHFMRLKRKKTVVVGSAVKLAVMKTLPRYKQLEKRQKRLTLLSWTSLAVVSLSLLIVAARPTKSLTSEDHPVGLDVMVVLDTSGSMKQYFQVVGESLNEMVSQFKTDRLGMIVFAGEAEQVLPLTDDYTEIKSVADYMVDHSPEEFRTRYAYATAGGTDISSGLYLASVRMESLPAERTKIVVLISDGQQTTSSKNDPNYTKPTDTKPVINAAGILGKQNVRIYSIAVPGDGYSSGDFKSGRDLLEAVSKQASGRVYDADDESAAKEVFGEINKLLRKEVDGRQTTVQYEDPWLWLVIAFCSLAVFLFISSKKLDGGVL